MENEFDFGDYVEISLVKEVYSGVLLPSPEAGIYLLKLDSGYNIGIDKKKVVGVKVLKKAESKKPIFEVVNDSSKPTIGLVVCGGTIASRLNPGKGGVDFVSSTEDLFRFYPELFNRVNVKVDVSFMKGSENMDYKDWQKIAKSVSKFLKDKNISGVVVTQGTDSLHYTSSALSFFIQNPNKPVVLTYSQRSIDRASSDASLNLECAAIAATSDVCEVMVVGHANSSDDYCYGIAGTKVRKMHSSRRDAFKSINREPFFKVSREGIEKISDYRIFNKNREMIFDDSFSEDVAILKFYPGQDPDILDYYVEKGYKGIVIEFLGIGNIAVSGARKSWSKKLKEVISKGIFVCATAQTINGRLNPLIYVTGRELVDLGVVFLEDMLTETAFVKLSWILGHPEWNVKEKILENFCYEMNSRLVE